ncbi:MAG TPA: hypothetical protein VFA15_09035, partial [Nitrososphaera sp.]|nr:hypothetical protein [Nitrososphaera sp.]
MKVVFMQDQTGSTNWTRTPQVLPSDFEPLREVFRRQGGEAALGLIRDDSNRGLVRKRFPAPLPKPQPPVENDDIFEDAEAADNFQKQIVQWERDCALREKQIDQLFTDFLAEIKPLLEQKANARRTDVWSAVTRGDLCLNEGNAGWPQPTHRYLVLVTDGLDNVGKSRAAFKSGARVLLVNGSATVGSLASLNPDRFESVRAAIQEI